jgi:hypothetical protein
MRSVRASCLSPELRIGSPIVDLNVKIDHHPAAAPAAHQLDGRWRDCVIAELSLDSAVGEEKQ